jgi:hypothetical protein
MKIDQALETCVIDPIIAINWRNEGDQAAVKQETFLATNEAAMLLFICGAGKDCRRALPAG